MATSKRPAAAAKPAAKKTDNQTGKSKATGRVSPAGGKRRPIGAPEMPAAGPHARPHLTDASKTPGAGTLTDPSRPQDDTATSG
ncbi:hypothetical protein [Xanthobacter tagetidis]|jgi:hypothetical protein|uniref:Uncharacterized protein n=1 Tax=Xanthobacter tagetidis TaxID=60216 RepID=A0A3L7AGU0_9HYPH|nr:hypothetical protein [Xanthobacter tagetidis]MBB6306331.1 hypothetical protein [Xanthobacter tagetidis]RLP79599.1 hypothetical protein D9R14_08030 [Xanthobacter tagetidis]